jgi:hypothetical protein
MHNRGYSHCLRYIPVAGKEALDKSSLAKMLPNILWDLEVCGMGITLSLEVRGLPFTPRSMPLTPMIEAK